MELDVGYLIFPVCGIAAGAVSWTWFRAEDTDDASLFWGFMVPFALGVMVLYGLSRTETVRLKADPAFRLQRQLDAHPIYAAMKLYAKTEHAELHKALMADGLGGGAGVQKMFRDARPWLASLGTQRMGFADAAGRVAWAQMYVDTLAELRERSPEECFQVIARQPEGSRALQTGLSEANTRAFEALFAHHLQVTYEGMGSPKGRQPMAEFNEAARQWRVLMEQVKDRYGQAVADLLAHKKFAAAPPDTHGVVCAARIAQLNLFLQEPEPMAGVLVDSAMR